MHTLLALWCEGICDSCSGWEDFAKLLSFFIHTIDAYSLILFWDGALIHRTSLNLWNLKWESFIPPSLFVHCCDFVDRKLLQLSCCLLAVSNQRFALSFSLCDWKQVKHTCLFCKVDKVVVTVIAREKDIGKDICYPTSIVGVRTTAIAMFLRPSKCRYWVWFKTNKKLIKNQNTYQTGGQAQID